MPGRSTSCNLSVRPCTGGIHCFCAIMHPRECCTNGASCESPVQRVRARSALSSNISPLRQRSLRTRSNALQKQHRPACMATAIRARLVSIGAGDQASARRIRHQPQRRVEDRSVIVLRRPQDATLSRGSNESARPGTFPAENTRKSNPRFHMEKLETTRLTVIMLTHIRLRHPVSTSP